MDKQIHYLPFDKLRAIERGQGIVNYPIAQAELGAQNIHSGITHLPVGASVPRHSHNAEEQVTVLEGRLKICLDDQIFECGPYDSTFITAGVTHEFSNIGDKPARVMVTYGSARITRTFSDTGETVELGSEHDKFPPMNAES